MSDSVGYRDSEISSLSLTVPFPSKYTSQLLGHLHIDMTNIALSRQYELMAHLNVDVEEFRLLLTALVYVCALCTN
jgi:hypothetical protein